MKSFFLIIIVLTVFTLGTLLRAKTNIRVFNYLNLGLLVLVALWSYFTAKDMSGGVVWSWIIFVIIYGTPVFISLIIGNMFQYLKKPNR